MGALALAEAGLRPLVLAKGQGATHWTGGTIDVWGLCPFNDTQPCTPAAWHQTRNSNFIATLRSNGGEDHRFGREP